MMKFNCYCDCDGVLAYFNQNVRTFFGKHPSDMNTDEMWKLINQEPDFWPTVPKKDGADRLWAVLKPYNPIILTGCPKDNFEVAAVHKREWIKLHFGTSRVITCLAKDKQTHMTAPGDILIDDFMSNIKRWTKAGGRGIWFRNADQAIVEFKKMVESDDKKI